MLSFFVSDFAFSQSDIISDNVLIGPGATGLGGAFTAVADDPTAIIYNPAGLVHISANKRSLSYNAYMTATYGIDNIVFHSELKSEAYYTPFFAGTSDRSPTLPSWTFAAAAYDRGIYAARRRWIASGNESITINGNSTAIGGSFESVSRHSGSSLTIAGAAARATQLGAYGITIGLRNEAESSQEFTKSFFGPFDFEDKTVYSHSTSNVDHEAKGYAIELGLGGLWKKDNWTFGATVGQVNYRFQKRDSIEDSNYLSTDENGNPATTRIEDKDIPIPATIEHVETTDNYPFGRPPVRYRLGVAQNLTSSTRWSADIIGRGFSHTEHATIQPGADGALGIETAITSSFSTRLGLFSTMDQANTLSSTGYRRADSYVDSLGVTSMFLYRAEGWSLSLGALYQRGQGTLGEVRQEKKDVTLNVSSFSASFTSDQ